MICLPRFLNRNRSDALLHANVSIALDSLIRAVRACLRHDSPAWLREVYAGLMMVRKRLEDHERKRP